MLIFIRLTDFAVVSEAELHLVDGLTVITGETGAGKSLLVDALLCLTGSRADAGMVRQGAERAELAVEFDLSDAPAARQWLIDNELDEDDECHLRRVIRADGGSKAWINGRAATLSQLNELGAMLVEIHGQHEHQALMQRHLQLELLDSFGQHQDLNDEVKRIAKQWQSVQDAINALQARGDVSERLASLESQHKELSRDVIDLAALEKLQNDHKRAAHSQQLLSACDNSLSILDSDESATPSRLLRRVRAELANAQEHEPRLAELIPQIESIDVELSELARAIEHIRDDLPLDGDAYAAAEAKLSRLHELARKHRVRVEHLPALSDEMQSEIDTLQNAGSILEKQQAQLSQLQNDWENAASKLSKARVKAGKSMSTQVSALMSELGMAGGRFEIGFEEYSAQPNAVGFERCEFLVSANPGQSPRSLRKVASGGELARISLAIEVAALGLDNVPTMIFDEVDSGIGGAVAEIVGRKLRVLGETRQVMCVTHLPQVAAQGHHHFRVQKSVANEQTHSMVNSLNKDERIQEIARMLGGVDIGKATIANAKQMLLAAQE